MDDEEKITEPDEEKGLIILPAVHENDTEEKADVSDDTKAGAREKIYSDARYIPVDETTAPPRYYKCKPRGKHTRKVKPLSGTLKTALLCLACALIGGAAGSAITSGSLSDRVAALEAQPSPTPVVISQTVRSTDSASTISTGVSASDTEIYNRACSQVVDISAEITVTNAFRMQSTTEASGTGFIVSPDGYILTNYHVIEDAINYNADITVSTYDGTEYTASVVGSDETNDIAVLKIEGDNLQTVTLGDSSTLSVGEEIFTVGNPLGDLGFSVTFGRISALDRMVQTSTTNLAIDMFQIDAAVNSGNSGGPVFDACGNVIGIVTAKYSASGVEGLGFAIPINDAVSVANELITNGYVTGRAYLGISVDERYTEAYARYYDMPQGAYVFSVAAGSPAAECGIGQGDIITAIGDYTIESASDLKTAINMYRAGDTVGLSLYRNGETVDCTVTFTEVSSEGSPSYTY